jgi:class 3 adenylate cyclase/tetratricopeptide (TPR) repeat protein
MLAAIKTLRTPESKSWAEAELRQVTVLFADLAGFTKLSQDLYPEVLHALVARYLETVDGIVVDHGGNVDKHIGDCVMAVFGAPVAHSNDAERAARAALRIQEASREMVHSGNMTLGVHIGIASGQVIASGLGGEGSREYTVTGQSVNLASRLTGLASAGETFVSDAVFREISDLFECAETKAVDVKGLDAPVTAWRLLRPHSAGRALPFVGRTRERGILRDALELCRDTRRGQAIYIRGEAGMGKTRLLEQMGAEARGLGFDCHAALVIDFGVASGQEAVGMLTRSLLGCAQSAKNPEIEEAAERVVAAGMFEENRRVFLSELLGLPQPDALRRLYDAMDTQTRNDGKRGALVELVHAVSLKSPLMLVIEDVHWADASTLDYLVALMETVVPCPVVLVMTSRMEGDSLDQAWRAKIGESPILTLDLEPLDAEESRQLAILVGERDGNVTKNCIERAAGNPLFLEQLLRHTMENAEQSLPGSIQSIVQSRVDKLVPADHDALQAASVLGQCFGLDALRGLIAQPDYDCAHLTEQFLIRPYNDGYLFSHALIRDSIYSSLLRARSEHLHIRAAEWYAGRDLSLTAEHLDRAGNAGAAAAYLAAAEEQERMFRFERALALARRGYALADDQNCRFTLLCLQGDLLRELGLTAQSIEAFEAALELVETDADRIRGWIGLVAGMRIADRIDDAFQLLDQAQSLATEGAHAADLSQIHYFRGSLYFPRGDITGCIEQHGLALDYATQANAPQFEAQALSGLGDACYAQGRMRSAHRQIETCLDLCRQHGLGRVEAANLFMLGTVRIYLNDIEGALAASLESVDVAERVGHRRAEIVSRLTAGWIYISMGDLPAARTQIETGLKVTSDFGARRFEPFLTESLSRIALAEGDRGRALDLIVKALDDARELDAMNFIGPWILGTLARVTEDTGQRQAAFNEGTALLAKGCVGHNYYRFYQGAMEACIVAADWAGLEEFANAFAEYTAPEPVPWSDFYIARARALRDFGTGKRGDRVIEALTSLRETAQSVGLISAIPLLQAALDAA